MPWPVVTTSNSSCAYEQCEQTGHAVCHRFAEYYEGLCEAAQAVVDEPTEANLARLLEILSENKGLING
jgi:hypothetical protein